MLDHPHTSAGRVPDRGGLSPLRDRARAHRRAGRAVSRRPLDRAPRARHGPACDDGGAREHDPAARRGLGALAGNDRGAPRRAAAPAAERRHGGRDHRDRRRREASLRVRRPGRLRTRRLGDDLPRGDRHGPPAGRPPARVATGRQLARQVRARVPRDALLRSSPSSPTTGLAGSSSAAPRHCSPSCAGETSRRSATWSPRSRSASTCSRSCAARSTGERLTVRVGDDLSAPALRPLALVTASYGLANRPLGTVSVLGPTRMDYAVALRSVRAAALALSDFVEELYS